MVVDRIRRYFRGGENVLAFAALALLSLIPVAEVVTRLTSDSGIPAAHDYIVHLVLWVTFLGGMITSREDRHLAMSVGAELLARRTRGGSRIFTSFVSATITTGFMWSALSMVLLGFDPTERIGFLPIRVATMIMPIGFAVMSYRFISRVFREPYGPIVILAILFGTFLGVGPIVNIVTTISANPPQYLLSLNDLFYTVGGVAAWPVVIVLIVAALAGTPLFVVLGGIAYMLFVRSGGALAVITNESYTLLIGNTIPAIPLFTFTGFLLSESGAGDRLVRLFRSWFGWLPGGLLVMAVLVCTFFTTFTGASGVTILALGGLLAFVLSQRGVGKNFGNGILTAAGSVGLLFPPSLPIILYGVVAQISIKSMFVAGILPGIVMVLALSVIGVIYAVRTRIKVIPFNLKEAFASLRESVWEILLPVVILVAFFGGFTTLEETGAIAVVYVFLVEVLIHRDLPLRKIPEVMLKCLPILGGVLVILAMAKGLSYYIVDAQIPVHLTTWVQAHVHSRYVFLILLNIALLVTGALMDIYSAILVVVPLILPLGKLFGIDPLHLGVIFLANLELGFLTPPVGLNLFLASYTFNQPLVTVYKNVLPFLLALLVTVLIITYVPWFSTGLGRLLHF